MIARALLALAALVFSAAAFAHKPSDSYLTLNVSSSSGDIRGEGSVRLTGDVR